jgi:hypothetical protein
MGLDKDFIEEVKLAFYEMQTKGDLLELMNFVKPKLYGKKTLPFELKQLTWHAQSNIAKKRYNVITIGKKSGGHRVIHAPYKGLKAMQRTINLILQCIFSPHEAAMGFVVGKSIVDNAKMHAGANYVYNIDLKDFFHSIDQARVWKCMQLRPFNLTSQGGEPRWFTIAEFKKECLKSDNPIKLGKFSNGRYAALTDVGFIYGAKNFDPKKEVFILIGGKATKTKKGDSLENSYWLVNKVQKENRLEIANIIAGLCSTELEVERINKSGEYEKVKRNVLPQGAPTSPLMTNIVCQRLDFLLTGLAKRFDIKYSRYADDITFSSVYNAFNPATETGSQFLNELERIISDQGFRLNSAKTRLQKTGHRKEVTGLLVNEKVNVQKRYIKDLRKWLYYWERYGYERAYSYFLPQHLEDKGHVSTGKPDMVKVISGKLNFLKMVRGADNELYIKLKDRFDKRSTINSNSEEITKPEITSEIDTSQVKITLEIYQSPEMNEKLNNAINIPKDTAVPSTIIIPNSIEKIKDREIESNNLYPIHHTPIKTVELLKYFTANDKDLKYSTHSWEEGKYNSYEEYIENIKLEWNEIKDELKNQSLRLFAKISNFLFNENLGQKNEKGYYDVWGEKRLKFGWASPELRIHMKEPGNSPFSCPIPDKIKDLDKKHSLVYFKDYADIFKNEIEFREDSNNFKKMILDLWESELSYDFEIKGIKELVGFSFFTDVSYVKHSIRILFGDLFKTKPEFPLIIIEKQSNFENEGYHLIRITQKNSFVTRKIDDPKFANPTGNLHSIIENLKNLADYSIISRFADGKNYRINYLTSTENKFIQELEICDEVLGFTHEFKFYL